MAEIESVGKPKPNFFPALAALMDAHGMADWAVVARAVDGEAKSTWVAGAADSVVEDEARGMYLHGKLAQLQLSILERWKPKK